MSHQIGPTLNLLRTEYEYLSHRQSDFR